MQSHGSWCSYCKVAPPATFTVLSVAEKHLCSALHVKLFSFFQLCEETVIVLVIWVVFLLRLPVFPCGGDPSISQVTVASKTVWTKHVAVTSESSVTFSMTLWKLGMSTRTTGGALQRAAGRHFCWYTFIWLQLLSVFHLMLFHQKQPFLPLQTSIVFVNSTLLWTDLHVKFEPFSHLVISGLISLLRLKVLGTSTLCSSVLVCWMLRVWLSCSHSTVRGRGKKPLRVQMSLTAVAPHSQTWCSVMLGDTVRGSEIKMRLVCL